MAAEISNTLIEYMVPMRDGVKLYTLVQLPGPEGNFPTIIKRNPYADVTPEMERFRTENTHGYAIEPEEAKATAFRTSTNIMTDLTLLTGSGNRIFTTENSSLRVQVT